MDEEIILKEYMDKEGFDFENPEQREYIRESNFFHFYLSLARFKEEIDYHIDSLPLVSSVIEPGVLGEKPMAYLNEKLKMRQLAESTISRNIDKFIAGCKFLNDPKYYKNNIWIWAHWQSWAATGKDGGCNTCNANHYEATLHNRRHNRRGSKRSRITLSKFCGNCVKRIKEKIGAEFKETYAP